MNVHDTTIVEMHELMFAATLDGSHARATQGTQRGRRDATPERRMQHLNPRDGRVLNRAAQGTDRSFDFR
jgi:hypothetical protein